MTLIRHIYLAFLFMLYGSPLIAQDFTSKNNRIGNWKDNNTWIENSIPSNTGAVNSSVNIEGTVTLVNDYLVLDNNNLSVITDTLWIQGDLTIRAGSSLTVNPGGVLIVDGTIFLHSGEIHNQGITSVDNWDIQGGSIINEDRFYTFNVKNNNVYGYGSITNHEPFRDMGDFENEHGALFEKLQNGTLPIQLLSFTATAEENAVQLDWISAWEENFDFYTVERAGKNREFKAIGTVKGQGNSTKETAYSFTDHEPIAGQSFYRLKATDFDGSSEHHKIISAHFEGLQLKKINVYPNPVTHHFFHLDTTAPYESRLIVTNGIGKTVYSQKVQRGSNAIYLPRDILPGVYVLIIQNELGDQQRQKIIIL